MNYGDTNTEKILQLFRSGNTESFAIIFHQFYSEICFFAKRILDQPRTAEKIVETIFSDLWRSHEKFDNWTAIRAYLYKNVRDACFSVTETAHWGIEDDGVSAYVWREATEFIEQKLKQKDLIKEIHYDPMENLPQGLITVLNDSRTAAEQQNFIQAF